MRLSVPEFRNTVAAITVGDGLDVRVNTVGDWWVQIESSELPEEFARGRKWRISPYMTVSEVVQTVLAASLAWHEHEAREQFLFQGSRIFGPHLDVYELMMIADRLDVRP